MRNGEFGSRNEVGKQSGWLQIVQCGFRVEMTGDDKLPSWVLTAGGLDFSAVAGLKSGQFNQNGNLMALEFSLLTGSTGWTRYFCTKPRKN